MTEIKRVQEYDNKKTSLPAPLNIIFRRSSLSVIVRLDRAIPSSCHYPADFIIVIIHPFLPLSLSSIIFLLSLPRILFLCHYPA